MLSQQHPPSRVKSTLWVQPYAIVLLLAASILVVQQISYRPTSELKHNRHISSDAADAPAGLTSALGAGSTRSESGAGSERGGDGHEAAKAAHTASSQHDGAPSSSAPLASAREAAPAGNERTTMAVAAERGGVKRRAGGRGDDGKAESKGKWGKEERRKELEQLLSREEGGHTPQQPGDGTVELAVAALNSRFAALPPPQQPAALLAWAASAFPRQRWAVVTSFGEAGVATLATLQLKHALQDPLVITVDTLHLFPETYQHIHNVREHFGERKEEAMEVEVARTKHAQSKAEFQRKFGAKLWGLSEDLYNYVAKVRPMLDALDTHRILAWTTGRRASQGGMRRELPLVELEAGEWRLKLNPFARWELAEVRQFVEKAGAPHNPLYDKGFLSVGDVHSTLPSDATNGSLPVSVRERSGRFKGKRNNECGMHLPHTDKTEDGLRKLEKRLLSAYQWEATAAEKSAKSGIIQVTAESFEESVLHSPDSVLLFIFSPMCPHCHKFQSQFVQLANSVAGDRELAGLRLARMDALQNKLPKKFASYSYRSFPTLFLAVKGRKEKPIKFEGRREASVLRQWLLANLKPQPPT